MPPIRLHDLWHGAAMLAFAALADMKEVQRLLRHGSYLPKLIAHVAHTRP
jgi:hypothetical protein